MPDPVEPLILDLLEWIGPHSRPYAEVMEAWRTSCPRLPVWEEANERGFIDHIHEPGQAGRVALSALGLARLRSKPFAIRTATVEDAPALLAIYRPYVENTPVSFEVEPPDVVAYAARIRKALAGWQWLVAERDGEVLGYVYGSVHRDRPAYRWSVEVTAYVRPGAQRSGVGRALYEQLFRDLAAKGYCNAFAGVTLPNDASVGLHTAVGFEPVGVFKSIGYKFGRWHDVAWFQRKLRDGPPPEPALNWRAE